MEIMDSLDEDNRSTLRINQLRILYFILVKYSCDTIYNIIFII